MDADKERPNTPIGLIAAAGLALCGDRWQTDIARDLNLSDGRRVRQWLSGDRTIPPGVYRDLVALLTERKEKIDHVVGALSLFINQNQDK